MKRNEIRWRILICTVFLTVLANGIMTGSACFLGQKITSQVQSGYDSIKFQNIYDYANAKMNDLQILRAALLNTDYTDYTSGYWNLKDEQEANFKREELNSRINRLNLSSNFVKSVYLLGYNFNQRSFMKDIKSTTWKEEDLPFYSDFFYSTVNKTYFDFLFAGNSEPFFIGRNEIKKELPEHANRMYNKVADKFMNLADILENNIVISNPYTSVYKNGVIVIVVNPGFLEGYLSAEPSHKEKITLLDKNNRLVWSNLELENNENPFTTVNEAAEGFQLAISGVNYSNRCKSLENSSFKLVYSIPVSEINNINNKMYVTFIVFFILTIIFTAILGSAFSNRISRPLKKLSVILKTQTHTSNFSNINIDSVTKKSFNRLTINQKIRFMLSTILLISMTACTLYTSNYIYNSTKKILNNSAAASSTNVYKSMNQLMSSYYLRSELIPFYEIENILKTPYSSSAASAKDIETVLVNQPLNLSYFANVILLGKSGNVKYQSVYPNNPQLLNIPFNVIEEKMENQNKDILWEYVEKDIFNQPAIAIVRKIYDSNETGTPGNNTIGYMELFLHSNPFQSINMGSGTEFMIFNDSNNAIYSSVQDQITSYSKAALAMLNGGTAAENIGHPALINNVSYLISYGTLPEKDWNIVIFQKSDEINIIRQQLLYNNLIVVGIVLSLALLLSLWIARFISKPVESIKSNMRKVGRGDFRRIDIFSKYDEINDLVISYNRMIEQITRLMQENVNQKLKENELITLKAQAELNMLQQQINPHFLYNSLEMINMQAMISKEDKISKMATSLSKLFRYTTKNNGMTVNLEQEIEHARNYIITQQLRFENKFIVNWNIEPAALGVKVLKFILQPLIENSINHGFCNISSGGVINIIVEYKVENLYIEVYDNGTGLNQTDLTKIRNSLVESLTENRPVTTKPSNGTGIALLNVNKRLHLFYYGLASMSIESEFMKWTRVTIRIPIQQPI